MNPNVDLSRFTRGGPSSSDAGGAPITPPAGQVAPPRRFISRYILPLLLLSGFATLGMVSMRDSLTPVLPVQVVMPIHLDTAGVSEAPGAPVFQAPGWIEPDPFSITVSALTEGSVERMHVLEGSTVVPGDPIADLVDDDARIAVDQAEAALQQARAEYEAEKANWENPVKLDEELGSAEAAARRLQAELADARRALDLAGKQAQIDRSLSRGGALGTFPALQTASALRAAELSVLETEARLAATSTTLNAARRNSQLRIDDKRKLAVSEAMLNTAQANLDAARLRMERTRIVAPTTGTVMRLFVGPGSAISMQMDGGMRICSLYDPEHIQVRAEVPLAEAAKVRPDLLAEIRIESMPDRTFHGKLTRIVHEADIQRNTLPVKVGILDPDPALKPEMVVRVQFTEPARPKDESTTAGTTIPTALFLPKSLAEANADAVWIVNPEQRADKRPVKWGERTSGDLREVLEGITPTDKVIVTGSANLEPGARVAMEDK